MSFFIIGRSKVTGALRLVSDETFDTRKDAVDALARMTIDDDLDSEAYVADLEAATPVFVVARATVPVEPAGAPVERSDGGTEEAEPAVAPAGLEVDASETAAAWEAPIDEGEEVSVAAGEGGPTAEAEEPPLAEVLKRAASNMEDEGIVVPESVGPEPAGEQQSSVEPSEPLAPVTADEPIPEAASASPGGEVDAWPWGSGEPVAQETATYVPDPLEEPAVDASTIVYAKGDEESVELSRTVYMGAYDESPTLDGAIETTDAGHSAVPETPTVESPFDAAPVASVGGIIADLDIEPEPGAATPTEPVVSEIVEDTRGSEVEGLTCDDCVYQNTCPNRSELSPATCGSFQWKAP